VTALPASVPSDLLAQLKALQPVNALVHLDFETFYSSDYSLSKLTTEATFATPDSR
jgi:hypothetical protein